MKLWMDGFYIGDITDEQAATLRENVKQTYEFVVAVDNGEEMHVVKVTR